MNQLLNTYLYHVGTHLPASSREDILKELSANILDQLENTPDSDNHTLEAILIELGSPEQVALGFTQSPPTLIATALISTYWLVVKFALMGLAIAFSVIGVLEFVTSNLTTSDFTKLLIQFISRIWSAGLGAFGMITLIFHLITKQLKGDSSSLSDLPNPEIEAWNLKALKALRPEPKPTSIVKSSTSIASIIGTIIGFIFLNSIAYGSDGNLWLGWTSGGTISTTSIQAFNADLLRSFMVYLNLLMASSLLLNLWLLIKGRWNLPTRVIHLLLELTGLGVFMALWLNPTLIAIEKTATTLTPEVYNALSISFDITKVIVAIVVTLAAAVTVFEDVKGMLADK